MEYRDRTALDNDLVMFKLTQSRDALEGARSALAAQMDLGFAVNGVFFGMYYAVLALFQKHQLPAASQAETIAAFDREFVKNGTFDWRFLQALTRAAELRKTCEHRESHKVTREDIDEILPVAQEFIGRVAELINTP